MADARGDINTGRPSYLRAFHGAAEVGSGISTREVGSRSRPLPCARPHACLLVRALQICIDRLFETNLDVSGRRHESPVTPPGLVPFVPATSKVSTQAHPASHRGWRILVRDCDLRGECLWSPTGTASATVHKIPTVVHTFTKTGSPPASDPRAGVTQ